MILVSPRTKNLYLKKEFSYIQKESLHISINFKFNDQKKEKESIKTNIHFTALYWFLLI